MKPVVLQLIDSFHQGGSERQALQLTRLLHASGRFDVRLASLNPDGVLRNDIEDLQLGEVPSFPLTAFYNANGIEQLKRFVTFLKANKIDVLHTHDFYTNIFGMTAGALARVPARVASMRETGGMRTRNQLRLQRITYSFAHSVVANSESVRRELLKQGVPANKTTVIYNGIDLSRVNLSNSRTRSQSFAEIGLPTSLNGEHKCVTLVANMRHDVKDYPMFLRAAKKVREAVPKSVFLLAGEGELMPSLQSLAVELGIENDTYFLGRCEALADLLNVSDVCVLSSKAEGFSNSILEYMAAGRPVVATDVGGASEAIVEGRTGHLVPTGNDELMGQRIIELLNNDSLMQMGAAGKEIAAERFSLEAQLKRTEELYDRLLARRRAN